MICQDKKKHRLLLKPAMIAAAVALSIALLYAAEVYHNGVMVEEEGTTVDCLKCHDGSKELRPGKGKIAPVRSHKVLVKYPPPGRGKAFKPLAEVLKAGIRFENGMITCISCHNLNNPNKNHFAVETNNSGYAQKLCYACHLDIG
ncbi:MAG: hypothetical protein A2505_08655 [Deltaproteobacteria bacterium RIFOXYD12_FULL_55_16]|nr:MAG: hypothetical protein A2505_08655 [Deltaproteobacteria bacterium RIFOXYD12_FULL_55_16]